MWGNAHIVGVGPMLLGFLLILSVRDEFSGGVGWVPEPTIRIVFFALKGDRDILGIWKAGAGGTS